MDFQILFTNTFYSIFSIVLLWKGADLLVESASRLARQFGISDLVIGLTVVAVGTSAPEFAVTISAAIAGKSSISIGNVVGSNIFNLGFILGGTACFRAIKTSPKILYRDGIFLFSVTVLLYLFLFGFELKPSTGSFSKTEGFILMGILISYMTYLIVKKEKSDEEIPEGKATPKDWGMLILGIIAVVGGGHLLVESASTIARQFGISDWVIGVTIVAAGTSAPELATSLMAVFKGRDGLAIGNLIGSDLFNLLGVLGLAAILKEMTVTSEAQTSIALLIAMVLLVLVFMRSGWKISRREGAFLVLINLARWIFDFSSRT